MTTPDVIARVYVDRIRGVPDRRPMADSGAPQQVLGERYRGNHDLVAVRRQRQFAVRICRLVVVWAGALFRVWYVRSGDRRRHSGPVILASFWIRHSRLRGDCTGLRHFRGAPDLALFRYHHRGVFADLLFFRGIGKAVDRRRRRHQLLIATDFLVRRRHGKLQRRRIFSTSSFSRPFRFASFSCIAWSKVRLARRSWQSATTTFGPR